MKMGGYRLPIMCCEHDAGSILVIFCFNFHSVLQHNQHVQFNQIVR